MEPQKVELPETTTPKRLGKSPVTARKIIKLVNSKDGNYLLYEDGSRVELTEEEWQGHLVSILGNQRRDAHAS